MKIPPIKPKHIFITAFIILLTSYSIYQARALILGPEVWIDSPQDGAVFREPLVIMEGGSRNIASISLNGRQIFTDEKGHWSEKLLVSPGLSIMTLSAKDRFGRETQKSIRIILPAQAGLN